MEPTMNASGSAKNSKLLIWIIIIIIAILVIVFAMRKQTEAPISESGGSISNSQLQAEVNGATTFDNNASLNAIDKEFQ